jgi:Phage endonuclease I
VERTYTPDFAIGTILIETKGRFTSADRSKMLAVKAAHLELDIRLLFMRDQPIRKGSKTRYSDWCVKHGFQYAIGAVPPEWGGQ